MLFLFAALIQVTSLEQGLQTQMPTGSKADSGNEEIGPGVIEVRVM